MAANVQELIEYCLYELAKIKKDKSRIIAAHFGTIKSFKEASKEDISNIKFVGGERALNLNSRELDRIILLQHSDQLDDSESPSTMFTKIIAKRFLETQFININQLKLEGLNCNPMLVTALKLDTPHKLLTYSVYQSASRSIVTSFGSTVQKLLLYSGENIFDAKYESSQHDTKWDLVKILGEVKSWIEVKSGPNDLDKTQIVSYKAAIESVEMNGEKAYIGETYGTRHQETITHSLYKQYLERWEERTLIGRELWDFVSDDESYHEKLMVSLREVAQSVLHDRSIIEAIEDKIEELKIIFSSRYDSVEAYIDSLW